MNATTEHESTSVMITSSEVVESAMDCFAVGSIFILEGQGGAGKTSMLKRELPEAMGIPAHRVFVVNCSGYPPSELVGYGIPDHDTKDMWFAKPEIWPHAEAVGNDECILVMDEFPQWAPEAQSLCRSVFDPTGGPPKIGSHELGPNVKICITANRACDGSRALRIDAPTTNRGGTYTLVPDLDDALDYYAREGLGLSPIFTFLKYTQGLNEVDHFNPPLGKQWKGGSHATPRSWEFALRYTKDLDASNLDSRRLERNLKAWVGNSAGSAAFTFIATIQRYIPALDSIRSGTGCMPQGDPSAQYSIAYAALRVAKKELKSAGLRPVDAVTGGHLDWLVEKIIIPAEGELRGWAYRTALAIGIPLEKHDSQRKMIGL